MRGAEDKDRYSLIRLKPDAQEELVIQMDEDFDLAIGAHNARIERYREFTRRFFNLPDEKKRIARVALIQEIVLSKMSREFGAIFGQGAEVVADPRGDEDSRMAAKAGAMVSYKFLSAMKPQRQMLQWIWQRNLLGRVIGYMPWEVKDFDTIENGVRARKVYYKGPCLYTCPADDIVTAPVKNVTSIQDFPYIFHRTRISFNELLRNVNSGKFYRLTSTQLNALMATADGTGESDASNDRITEGIDEAEGVMYGLSSGRVGRGRLQIRAWYGTVAQPNGEEEEVVARYEPETKTLLSVQSLVELYPQLAKRRPFVDGALLPVGGYWSMGLAQMLTIDEDELSANMELLRTAGEMAAMPPIGVEPTSGMKADSIRLEAGRAFDCKSAAGIKQIDIRFDPNYSVLNDNMTRAGVERKVGVSDYTQGRESTRPTAPKTATGTLALMQAGNERTGLDVDMLSLDVGDILERVYLYETSMGDPNEWYRVTEQKADGLVGARNGRFQMTDSERHGMYDFKLRMAAGPMEKEARRELMVTVYNLLLANPIVGMNPLALWNISAKLYRELLDENFSEVVPKPPDPGFSLPPKDEWTKMLQGEPVMVHPMDDDQKHIQDHIADAEDHEQGGDVDQKAMGLLQQHVAEHVKALNQKRLMQAMVQGLTQSLATNTPQTGGLTYQPPVSQNLAEIGTQLEGLMNPVEGQQPGGGQPGQKPGGAKKPGKPKPNGGGFGQ